MSKLMLLNLLSRTILKKNKSLYNIYKGETCYLFGNGYSIKFLDLNNFKNLNVFSTGLNYIHNDYKKLKVIADFHIHPGIFSPVWRHPYNKKLTFINKTRKFLLKTNRLNDKHNFFTSIYNYPFIKKKKNVYFLHNFNSQYDFKKIDPSSDFSLLTGSLFTMIGVGAYMGFKNFYFVGMDYLASKPKQGHFYEFGIRDNTVEINKYIERVKQITDFYNKKKNCNFYFMSLNELKSSIYQNINYENKFNTKENYKENYELINSSILKDLSNVEFEYFIYNKFN